MKKINIIIVIAAILTLVGCLGGGDSNPASPSVTQPNVEIFETIVSWDYRTTLYSGGTEKIFDKHQEVISDTIINGNTWYILAGSAMSSAREDGYYVMINNSPTLLFKHPAKEGDKYIVNNFEMTVEKNNELITTEAGSFKCTRFGMAINGGVQSVSVIYWYSPEIGIIQNQHWNVNDSDNPILSSQEKLIAYKKAVKN